MGAMQRRKGAVGEREVAEMLRAVFPNARRRACGEESQCDQGRDLDGTPGYVVQCQSSNAPTIERKLREAVGAAKAGEVPLAFTRRTRGEWIVTLRASDFLAILLAAQPIDEAPPSAAA